jgi:hypothetical protein
MKPGRFLLASRLAVARLGSAAMRFGVGAIREKPQRCFMHPRDDAIGCRPDLPITNNGPRLLGSTAEIDPGSDATCRRLVYGEYRGE